MEVLVVCLLVLLGVCAQSDFRGSLDEDFGYVEVRRGAHMFWVTYHVDQPGDWTHYPLIMWLQGGPGGSSTGFGNFEELGPYYVNGTKRDTAWTKKATVMFVDNPVGSGFSYVDDSTLLATTNQEIASDLLSLIKSVFNDFPEMSQMPFFVYAESYGGKMTVDFALALDQAIKKGEIKCNFQGVVLGDSWISPMDSVNTWAPFLYSMGLVNKQGKEAVAAAAAKTQAAVEGGLWRKATREWSFTEDAVTRETNGVNFYNVLAKDDIYDGIKSKPHTKFLSKMKPSIRALFDNHVSVLTSDDLDSFMNGAMARRWGIPAGVRWGSSADDVFRALQDDFMRPVVTSVAQLLNNTDITVTVFTGNLDLICDTPGTYRWIEGMAWHGKEDFNSQPRRPFHVPQYVSQAGYVQTGGQFSVFTLLRSGHMAPIDVPHAAIVMVDMITKTAAARRLTTYTKVENKLPQDQETTNKEPLDIVEKPQPTELEMKLDNNNIDSITIIVAGPPPSVTGAAAASPNAVYLRTPLSLFRAWLAAAAA